MAQPVGSVGIVFQNCPIAPLKNTIRQN